MKVQKALLSGKSLLAVGINEVKVFLLLEIWLEFLMKKEKILAKV